MRSVTTFLPNQALNSHSQQAMITRFNRDIVDIILMQPLPAVEDLAPRSLETMDSSFASHNLGAMDVLMGNNQASNPDNFEPLQSTSFAVNVLNKP